MQNIYFYLNRKLWLTLALMLSLAFPGLAQRITVHGYVDDDNGDPLIGATIMEKGTSNGVATDIDGKFTINVAPNSTLVVSYVGYDQVEVAVNNRSNIKITMNQNSTMLAETVVIGYGTVKKTDATGSVATVKPSEIEAGLATSAQDLLVGASPGVVVTTDGGNPAGGANIQIRGGASLNASNDPLIVIDGIPMESKGIVGASNPLALVSPENIESMTILKDASATAIFGSRASNGVIIITTKKGKSGRPQVNFTANMHVNTQRNYLDMMDGPTFAEYIRNRYGEDSEQASALGIGGTLYNTDWMKEALSTTISQDYSLSVGGTVGSLPYRVALSYTDNNGILRGTDMDRVTASINLTPKFFDDLLGINANVKGSYVHNNYADNNLSTCLSMNPTLPVKDPNGSALFSYWTSYVNGGSLADSTSAGTSINATSAPLNPLAGQLDKESSGKSYQSIGNLQFDLKMPFLRDLRANLNLGYDYQHGYWFGGNNPMTPAAWNSGYQIINSEGEIQTVKDGGVSRTEQHQTRINLLLDFFLNYNKELDAINSALDVTAGYSWQKFHNKYRSRTYVAEVGDPTNSEYLGVQANPTSIDRVPYQLVSFFGRVNYTFMERYLLTATVRYDGTSRFSKEHRWGTFPAFALGWKILEESFMECMRGWMTELKLRGGYGVTGQQDLNDDYFPYMPIYTMSTDGTGLYPSITGDGIGNYPITPGSYNANLKWEETHTWNLAIDYGFINNRITGSLELYKRKTKDLLTFASYPAGSNITNQGWMNLGDLENIGIEFDLITRPVVTDNLTWTSSLNVAWNKNKITRLAEGASTNVGSISAGTGGTIQKHEVGYPAYSFYVYEQVYDKNGDPMEGVYVDRNGDGQINESDKYLYHSRNPKVTMNWNNTINWKNWDFGITLRANLGNWVYNDTQVGKVNQSQNLSLPLNNMMNHTFLFEQSTTQSIMSDYFVQNASFLRCDNINLGYTWTNLFNNNLRLRLYGAVQNPFVITKYKGLDPEIFSGIDRGVYPRPVTFTLGLIASF